MPSFVYRARDISGKTFSGILEADDVRALRKKLRESGLYVIATKSQEEKKKFSLFQEKITIDTLIIFTHQLSSMLEAGLPILKALEILWREMDNLKMQVVISQLQNKLKEGGSLSQAVNMFPNVFPIMYRVLVSVAETGGGLVPVLQKLVEYLNNQKEFVAKIKKAVFYPVFVVAFAVVVVILMFVLVIPTFQKVFARINVDLPIITQVMINISSVMRSWLFWVIIIGLGVLGTYFYKKMKAKPAMHLKMDQLKLNLPVMGTIFYTASIGRFVRSLTLLLSSGLPATKAIEVSRATAINKQIEKALELTEQGIIGGMFLSVALKESKIFPNLLVEMVAVGEQSGSLPEMLSKVARHYEEELDMHLNKLLTLLEPILIILVGAIVVFVLLAIYLPIFSLWQGLPGL